MLGRTKLSLPVCNLSTAPPCAGFVPCTDCTRHRSSTQPATCGNSSLTHAPLSPCCWNFHGERNRFPVLANCTRGLANGQGRPSSRVSSGLGSKVSRCEGPPFMNRKITRFARAAKCGAGASPAAEARAGAANCGAESARQTASCRSNDRSAKAPNPTADCCSTARREPAIPAPPPPSSPCIARPSPRCFRSARPTVLTPPAPGASTRGRGISWNPPRRQFAPADLSSPLLRTCCHQPAGTSPLAPIHRHRTTAMDQRLRPPARPATESRQTP